MPLPTDPPEGFDAPWQAEAYALGQALIAAGHVSADDWAKALGDSLRQRLHGAGMPDNAETYAAALVDALASVTSGTGIVSAEELLDRTEAWRTAYAQTPHGEPVILD